MANEAIPAAAYAQMQTIARTILEGCGSSVSVSITYSHQTARTVAPSTGAVTTTKTDTSVTASRLTNGTKGSKSTENAMTEVGPVCYLVEKRRLAFEPSKRDRITESSKVYEVLEFSHDAAGLFWVFQCAKVGV